MLSNLAVAFVIPRPPGKIISEDPDNDFGLILLPRLSRDSQMSLCCIM